MRLGLLGCGRWGRNLLREAVSLGASVSVVDPSEPALALARENGASHAVASLDALPDVDALLVATPASTHASVIESVLGRNVPVFTEKPFALALRDVELLLERAGDRIFELHVWRYHPAVLRLRELHRSGELGTLRWLRTTRTNWTSPRTDCDPVWTLLPHDFSIALEITGELPPVTHARAEQSGDRAVGMLAELSGSFTFVAETSTRDAVKRREIRLHGDEAIAVMPADGDEVLVHVGNAQSERPSTRSIKVSGEPALRAQMRAIVGFLRGGPPPSSDARDALLIAGRMNDARRMAGL